MSAVKIGPEFHVWVEAEVKYKNDTVRATYDSDDGYWQFNDKSGKWSAKKIEAFNNWMNDNLPVPTLTLGEGIYEYGGLDWPMEVLQ